MLKYVCIFYERCAGTLQTTFLYFLPLPHGQGSLCPIVFSAIFGTDGFNSLSTSETSSGLSGSKPIIKCHPCSSHIDVISPALSTFFQDAADVLTRENTQLTQQQSPRR